MPHLLASGPFRIFLNTFGTAFTLKIQRVDSVNYFNFIFILHKITFHLKLHSFLELPAF
jgi:hypothetical protein